MREVIKIVGSILLGAIVGFVVGSLGTSILKLKWKDEIGLEPFINLLTALVVAVFFAQAFQRLVDARKLEQSWVLEPFKQALRILQGMRGEFESTYKARIVRGEKVEKFVRQNRTFANHLNEAMEILEVLGYSKEHKGCADLLHLSVLYKQSLTDGDPLAVYSPNDNTRHQRNYSELNKALLKMAVNIGRKL